MTDRIPEYYQGLAREDDTTGTGENSNSTPASSRSLSADGDGVNAFISGRYGADSFTFEIPDGNWRDRTIHTIAGPTVDGLHHQIAITSSARRGPESLSSYARRTMESVKLDFGDAEVLRDDEVFLSCGQPAHRAIFVLTILEERRYLEQLYVGGRTNWYSLSALFTRNSRRKIGADVQDIMLSFKPESVQARSGHSRKRSHTGR